MKTLDTIAGHTYVVSSPNGGTVTSADGLVKEDVEAGKQKVFFGTGAPLQLDDEDGKIMATFKSAPAALMALANGGSGGGSSVSSALPDGYMAAEFIQNTGQQQFYTDQKEANLTELWADFQLVSWTSDYGRLFSNAPTSGVSTETSMLHIAGSFGWWVHMRQSPAVSGFEAYNISDISERKPLIINEVNAYIGAKQMVQTVAPTVSDNNYPIGLFARRLDTGEPTATIFRIYHFVCREGNKISSDIVPVLSKEGEPCFYDWARKKVYKSKETSPAIVGMTLKQARKIKLPSTGGNLLLSLPSGWQDDVETVDALSKAEENGWIIDYRTSDSKDKGASTFALKRIWVKKEQYKYGNYVDAKGMRYSIKWCEGVLGAEPTTLGYEPYRSLESAVADWGLEPYVYTEELLTE